MHQLLSNFDTTEERPDLKLIDSKGLKVVKSDNIDVEISESQNGFSKSVLITASADIHSGWFVCKACKEEECSQKATPLFVTGLFQNSLKVLLKATFCPPSDETL